MSIESTDSRTSGDSLLGDIAALEAGVKERRAAASSGDQAAVKKSPSAIDLDSLMGDIGSTLQRSTSRVRPAPHAHA